MPVAATDLVPPPQVLARRARLRYTCDDEEGIHRIVRAKRVTYQDASGHVIHDRRQLTRIESLGIPPAWTDVWICVSERGHLQATGRDARGRKQYLYHAEWHLHAGRTKFKKLRAFGEALASLRQQVARHLRKPGLPQEKVIAAVIALLDGTLVRVGNEEYAKANGSYGLTTLRDHHADVRGPTIHLQFKGKSGKMLEIDFRDQRLARIVRECQDLPGQQLFQYLDSEGDLHRLESADVNRYLRAVTGCPFTAKDFRTWKATVLVLERLLNEESARSATAARRAVSQAIRAAAEALGNTVTVCRKYYVHPQVTQLFLADKLARLCGSVPPPKRRLNSYEQLLLRLLRKLETWKGHSNAERAGIRFARALFGGELS